MENKFDLLILCEGAEELRMIDLTKEKDGDAIIRNVRGAIMAVMKKRGRGFITLEQSGGCHVEIGKGKVSNAE